VSKKDKQSADDKNRKNYATEKWEQDLRAELEAKRAAQQNKPKMTKEEYALVEAQRLKESEIRGAVQALNKNLDCGLAVLEAIVAGDAFAAHEYLPSIQALAFYVAESNRHLLPFGWTAAQRAMDIYFSLAKVCTEEISAFASAYAAATCRHRDLPVPLGWDQESLVDQTLRCVNALHELLTDEMVDQGPLSPQTLAFCFPLMECVVKAAVEKKDDYADLLEKIVAIVELHADQGASEAMPRQTMIQTMLKLIDAFPQVAKAAQVTLFDK
jgi:hypothetical protein